MALNPEEMEQFRIRLAKLMAEIAMQQRRMAQAEQEAKVIRERLERDGVLEAGQARLSAAPPGVD